MSSLIDCVDGNSGDACLLDIGVCVKCGIVEMSGDNAQGLSFDCKSCSNVGSTMLNKAGMSVDITN